MSIEGFIVELSPFSYETPACCASCLGPAQTQVETRAMERLGNLKRTLTMTFPYCESCAKRARREHTRTTFVAVLASAAGIGLAFAAWHVHFAAAAPVRFAVALLLAMTIAALLALVTRPSAVAPPATARGEAVLLKSTSGRVFCTNPRYAELLAKANLRTANPGTHWLTAEVWAPLGALLCGLVVVLCWVKAGVAKPVEPLQTSMHVAATAPATKKH